MNPVILNPDPLAILKEANRIYDPTRQTRPKDGFTIIDGNRDKAGGWTDSAQQAESIKRNFDYTADNFNEAKIRAAREGKALVVVAGNNNAETKQLVDGIIPGAKDGKAIFVYADVNKLDPNSELGRELAASRGDMNHPYTAIFAPRANADGSPGLERHLANMWGARSSLSAEIKDQVGHAKSTMDMRRGTFILPPEGQKTDNSGPRSRGLDFSERTEKREISEAEKQRKAETEAESRVVPQAKTIIDSFKQLKGANFATREELYGKAEAAASKLDPKDVELVKQKNSRELKAELAKGDSADKTQVETLKSRQMVLDLMANAPAWTRMNHGVSLMHYSQLGEGVAKIQEGGKINPAYLNNPQFIEQLLKTPYELKTLKEKLPGVKFDEYLKHKSAGTVDKFVAEEKALEKKAEPQATPAEGKPEQSAKQPEKLKYGGEDYQKGLEDAFNSGRRYVVKVGGEHCDGCIEMEKNAWPDTRVQKNLHDKAVFANVDGEKQEELATSLGVQSWPAVLVVEPYKDSTGKVMGRIVSKIEPNSPESRSADSLSKFLTDNLTDPKPPQLAPKQEAPQAQVRPEVEPEVRPEKPKEGALDQSNKATFERLSANHRKILAPLQALNEKSDAKTIDAAFEAAIKSAKEVNPQDIARAKAALEANKKTLAASTAGGAPDKAAEAEFAKIDADMRMITKIEQSEGYLNISRGAVRLKMNPDNPELGKADIKAGLALRPELGRDQTVLAKLASTGYDAATLKQWFPELQIDKVQPAKTQTDPAKVFDRLREQHSANLQPFADLPENASEAQIQNAFAKAIESASKVDQADVNFAITTLSARRQAILTQANGAPLSQSAADEVQQIDKDISNYSNIGMANGLLHISNGVRKLGQDKAHPEAGIAEVRRGLALQPVLKEDYSSMMERLKASGYDEATLRNFFPELAALRKTGEDKPTEEQRPKFPPVRR